MKKREWTLLAFALLIFLAGAVALFQYRTANEASPVPSAPAQTENSEAEAQPSPGTPSVQLRITRDFGAVKILDRQVPVEEGDTVMDVLKRNGGEVKTSYGGGFVESIQGISSAYQPGDTASRKLDWFYYVNGLVGDVGAGEYPAEPGDVIWWDYHDWSYAMNTPAQVGVFPHPFAKREEGEKLLILAAPGHEQAAGIVANALSAVDGRSISSVPWQEERLAEEAMIILVGDVKTLQASPFVSQIFSHQADFGLFAGLSETGLQAFDQSGNPVQHFAENGTGLLAGSLHPETRMPLWFVSGIGAEGVEAAAKALVNTAGGGQPSAQGYFGLIIAGGKAVGLPISTEAGGAN